MPNRVIAMAANIFEFGLGPAFVKQTVSLRWFVDLQLESYPNNAN
jgi:hypothetical protein